VFRRPSVAAPLYRLLFPREARLHRKYADATMVGLVRFVENLRLLRNVNVPGSLVECGTWRGGMSAAMAEMLPGRTSYLFDSFEGLPPPGDRDGDRAHLQIEVDRFVASEAEARATMARSGAAFETRPGWFDDTVPVFANEAGAIAVLRLDGDWYESTMVCLEHLFPLLEVGGLLIIDDYAEWEGCTRATHDYLSREQRREAINRSRHGVTSITKLDA
jgi:O-methyltransferase